MAPTSNHFNARQAGGRRFCRWRFGLPLGCAGCALLGSQLLLVTQASAQQIVASPSGGGTICADGGGALTTGVITLGACVPGTDITTLTFEGASPATETVTIEGTGITMGADADLSVGGFTTTNGLDNTGNIDTTTLSTSGLATLDSASVTNNATVGGTLGVTGTTTTNGITNTGNVGTTTLSTTGAATIGTTLGVTGATTTNGIINTGNVGTSTLSTTGAATIGTTLGVTGATTTNGITNTGNVGTSTLSTTGAATVGTTLGVTGATTLQSTLDVTGATTTMGVTNTGKVTTDRLTVNNNTDVGGTLDVTGATTTNGVTNTGNVTTDTLTVNHATDIAGPLNVAGVATFNGPAVFNGGVVIPGGFTFDGPFTATGPTTLESTLTVARKATFNGGVEVKKNLTVVPKTTVRMGGNRIQDVGTPVAATDAATKGYVDSALAQSNARLDHAFQKLDEHAEGLAVAMAMGGLSLPDRKAFAMSANMGFYEDKQALSGQAAMRLNQSLALTGGVGIGLNGGKVGGRVGLMAAW